MSATESRNRLADEISPYLLQHADNPVDWYPWGEEALQRARQEDKPILLSVGYAACHWCHVMEHESFEDPDTAALMNDEFVCIKVDREERPDIDEIYMRAVQMMTGHGGWPLTVFLTPDLEPFYGGTYYPPEDRPGMPSFRKVLRGIADAWKDRRDEVRSTGARLRQRLQPAAADQGGAEKVSGALLERAVADLEERFDPNHGGFGEPPKFPNPTSVALLIRHAARHDDRDVLQTATFTLDQMAAGGIYDHVGGGFHRYATDAAWLVPHFEKMLYDNALLAGDYLDAYQLSGHDRHARVVRETLEWALREMQQSEGGFSSTLDADSEGVEGKFYVWDREEIVDALGEGADLFCRAYGVTESGNWEGKNILHLPRRLAALARELDETEEELRDRLQRDLARLREVREERVRPGLDDKVLVDWNGLMIAAMARAGRVLGDDEYLRRAGRAADFILEALVRDGRLLHAWRDGEPRVLGYLDDHANLLLALLELFESTFELRWLESARATADAMIELFSHGEEDAFFFTGSDHEELIARSRTGHDGATPSGNAVAATALRRLGRLCGDDAYARRADAIIAAFGDQLQRAPSVFGQMLLAVDDQIRPSREIVVAGTGDATRDALARLWSQYAPSRLVVQLDPEADDLAERAAELPLLAGKAEAMDERRPLFFVCENYACQAPTPDLDAALDTGS